VLNVFRMYGLMKGNRIPVEDSSALACADVHSLSVMCWNYWEEDVSGVADTVKITFAGLPAGKVMVHRYSIDNQHSNAYEAWKRMGSPQSVTAGQYRQLEQSGQLQQDGEPVSLPVTDGKSVCTLVLPAGAVSLVQLTF
jgi:xylan 1,4-beta-xylosidase